MDQSTVLRAVEFIQSRSSLTPKVGLILGSGLGGFAQQIRGDSIKFADIPGLASTSAPTHAGTLHLGYFKDVPVIVMNGRLHLYEGYSPSEVALPVQIMGLLGATKLLITNAAGGLNPNYKAGDVVLIEDHLSFANLSGQSPLRGPNDAALGPRFTSLNGAYSRKLIDLADRAAKKTGPTLQRGVYGFVVGPNLETPAEVRALRALGCDLVGMSTVPEVIAARHMGLDVMAVSAVANMAVSTIQDDHITTAEEVYASMAKISPKVQMLLENVLSLLASESLL